LRENGTLTVKNFYENAGILELKGGVTSFGQVFQQGELPAGRGLQALVLGQTSPVQVDIKTTYADGSAKMAVLTMARPDLAPGAVAQIQLSTTPAADAAKLDFAGGLAQHQFKVAFTSGGATSEVDVLKAMSDALAKGTASFWQEGPLATQARVEVQLPGSQRLLFDVTVFKGGGIEVEAQFNNDGAMEAVGGRATYQVAVTMDGRLALETTVSQAQYQNWHEGFSSDPRNGGQGLGAPSQGWLNIGHDVAYLQKAGAVAGYNLEIGVDEALLAGWGNTAAAPGWDAPLAIRDVTQYMPGTGGRGDIGITTVANTGWLMSQDARAAAFALGQAEAASSVPWHFWDTKSGTWLGTDAYPDLWTDGRGGTGTPGVSTSGGLTQQMDDNTGWDLDSSHQPSLSFVPYVLTGERWMLDNLQAQAAWNIVSLWPAPRGGDADLVVRDNQVRGAAWSLRQLDEAAWSSPDGSREKAQFAEASAANWSWIVSQIPTWTEWQGEAHGWLPGVYGYANVMPPWQQDYFASTAIAAAARGNADAMTYLKWASNFLVGRFTHAADGMPEHDGATYLLSMTDPVTGTPFQTWAEIGAKTAAWDNSNGDGWSKSQGDYGQLALATLAGLANVTGSVEAAEAYRALMSNPPPFTSATDFMRDPTYALAPPGGAYVVPVIVDSGSVAPTAPAPTAPAPTAPAPKTPAPDASTAPALVKISAILGADSWDGDPQAIVLVDGVEAFRGAISASHASGGVEVPLGSFTAGVVHQVTVRFLNDAWGGSADTDRNLYVENILVNGVATGKTAALAQTGDVTFDLAAVMPPAPTGGTTAGGTTAGGTTAAPVVSAPTETFTLRLGVSGDAYNGTPHFQLFLDGNELGGIRTTAASHALGEREFLDLQGSVTGASQVLTVRFLDDAWGGSAATDRNLYVDSLSLNGISLNKSAALERNGDVELSFSTAGTFASPAPSPEPAVSTPPVITAPVVTAPVVTPPVVTAPVVTEPVITGPFIGSGPILGSGNDVLRIGVSGDAWKGTPKFSVLVDGVKIGGVQTTSASHSADEESFLNVLGDFSPGLHKLAIRFLNDAFGGKASMDRNLYVESVEFNGVDLNYDASLQKNGDAVFQF